MKQFKISKVFFVFVSLFIGLNTLLHAEVPTRDSVTKLYVATFNRAPDAAGLTYWLDDSGLQLEQIAQSFFDQPETQESYPPGSTIEDLVEAVYQNLFNREPDQDGLDYWVEELSSKSIGKSIFILAVINGALDTEEFGNDATILENKTIVGLAYVDVELSDIELAREIMEEITDDEATVFAALETLVPDTTLPIITVLGNNPETVIQDTSYIDAGATAVDDRDEIVPVITAGTVDITTIGSYTITYTATDSAGNVSTATRTVNVNPTPEPPSTSALPQELMNSITYMYSEEGLAYDVYMNIYKRQKVNQLFNIATNSETKHIELVNELAIKYDLNITKYPDTDQPYSTDDLERYGSGEYPVEPIQELYNLLYDKGIQSKQDALEVGCMVEVVDIDDLTGYIVQAEAANAEDVLNTFNKLRNGSYSHYWTFDKGLKNMGITEGCCSLDLALGRDFCHPEYPKK